MVNHIDSAVVNHHMGDHSDPAFSDDEGETPQLKIHDDEDDDDIPLGELKKKKIKCLW